MIITHQQLIEWEYQARHDPAHKFDASGITTFEEEFLAHLVIKGGKTVGEQLSGQLEEVLAGGNIPLLGPRR